MTELLLPPRYSQKDQVRSDSAAKIVTFTAYDRERRQPVSISAHPILNRSEKEIILAEARLRSQIKSDSLAELYDYGYTSDSIPYIVQTLPDGRDLRDVPREYFSDVTYAAGLFQQILEAYADLHAAGLCAGYPARGVILVQGVGSASVQVLHNDVGALVLGRRDLGQVGTGDTPLAPERILAGYLDARSDFFLLGCALYEAITGRALARGPHFRMAREILYGDAPDLRAAAPDLPEPMCEWIERLLHRDRTQRFNSARDALRFLQRRGLVRDSIRLPGSSTIQYAALKPIGSEAVETTLKHFLADPGARPILEIAGERGTGKSLLLRSLFRELLLTEKPVIAVVQPTLRGIARAAEEYRERRRLAGGKAQVRSETMVALSADVLIDEIALDADSVQARGEKLVVLIDDTDRLDANVRAVIEGLAQYSLDYKGCIKILLAHNSQLRSFGQLSQIKTMSNLAPGVLGRLCAEALGPVEFGDDMQKMMYRVTNGNPLMVTLFLRKLIRDGILFVRENTWLTLSATLPPAPTMTGLLREEREALRHSASRIWDVLALSTRELRVGEIADALSLPLWTVVEDLHYLCQSGFVECRQGACRLTHDLYREAAIRDPLDYREQTATQAPADTGAQARLFEDAPAEGVAGSEQDFALLLRSLQELFARRKYRKLIQRCEPLLEAGDALTPEIRAEAAALTASAWRELGDEEREWSALEFLEAAAAKVSRIDLQAEALVRQVEIGLARGAGAVANDRAQRLRRTVGSAATGDEHVQTLAAYADFRCKLDQGDAPRVEEHAGELIQQLRRFDDKGRAALLAREVGQHARTVERNFSKAAEWYLRSAELYEEAKQILDAARALGNRALALAGMQSDEEAVEAFGRAVKHFRNAGDRRGELAALTHQTRLRLRMGAVGEAEVDARRAREVASELNDQETLTTIDALLARIDTQQEQHVAASPQPQPEQLALAGTSAAIRAVRDEIAKAAETGAPVLLDGPFGSGLDAAAEAIHARGKSADAEFVSVACADFDGNELIEYVFGADGILRGLTPGDSPTTVYLMDIDCAPLRFQTMLLNVLRAAVSGRGGGFRLISSCRRTPRDAVSSGRLKQELYYVLNIIFIRMPALADRREDIPDLVRGYTARYAQLFHRRIDDISGVLLQQLQQKPRWDGNLLELERLVQALVVRENTQILSGDIAMVEPPAVPSQPADPVAGRDSESSAMPASASTIDQVQREHIARVLQQTGGNKSRAAKILGIKRTTLLARMKKLGLMS